MSNLRIISKYTKAERAKLRKIQDIWKVCHAATERGLPNELALDPEKRRPVHKASDRDFNSATWIEQMGRGILRQYCESVCTCICEYQVERNKRIFQYAYPDDPFNLFLEEIKSFVTKTVSFLSCDKNARDLLRKRIRYFEHIMSEPNLFDPFSLHSKTMQQVIFECRKILRYEALPMVLKEIANSSAREDIRELELNIRHALDHSVKILYCIFRNTLEAPKNVTVGNLRQPVKDKYKALADTQSGMMLKELVSSGFFALVYQDSHFELEEVANQMNSDFGKAKPDAVTNNHFLDARGNSLCPATAMKFIEDPKVRSETTLANLFGEKSGFEVHFQKNRLAATTFIRAHGLVHELVKLVVVCEKARQLAGEGGDLLVYGLANAQVNAMLDTFDSLSKELRQTFEKLNQIAEVRFEQLVDDNKARDSVNPWVSYFRSINLLLENFDTDLEKAVLAAAHIRVAANSITMEERFQKAADDTELFVTQSLSFSKHVAGVLGQEWKAPAAPEYAMQLKKLTPVSAAGATGAEEFQETATAGRPLQVVGTIKAVPKTPIPSSPSPELKSGKLDLWRAGVTDGNLPMRVLLYLTKDVKDLNLEKNGITGEGAMVLFEHIHKYVPTITSINLWANHLGIDGAKALAALIIRPDSTLSHIDLNGNAIGDDGVFSIAAALMSNSRTLRYLDLAYNDIGDEGILSLVEAIKSPTCPLQFLKLGGNKFTSDAAMKLLQAFRDNANMIQVVVGGRDENPSLSQEAINAFHEVSKPRFKAWHAKRLEEEAAQKAAAQKVAETPKLLDISDSNIVPAVAAKRRREHTKKGAAKSGDRREAMMNAMDELVDDDGDYQIMATGTDDVNEKEEAEVMTEREFYDIIRLIQVLSAMHPTDPWVPRKKIAKAFEKRIYDVKIPNINYSLEDYLELARARGVIKFREQYNKDKLVSSLALEKSWANFEVPPTFNTTGSTAITQPIFDEFIVLCRGKPVAHKKRVKFLTWMRASSVQLQKAADDVLTNLIDLAIYCGIYVIHTDKKFKVNLDQKEWPIYLLWPGALKLQGIPNRQSGDSASGAATTPEPTKKKDKSK